MPSPNRLSHARAGLLLIAFIMACMAAAASADDERALKQDAVKRLTDSNDPTLSVYIGRVYVKQAALQAAREVLAERGRAAFEQIVALEKLGDLRQLVGLLS